jgi:hypothetical protein
LETGERQLVLNRLVEARQVADCRGSNGNKESDMMSEMQVHTIARQMFEKHGASAIAQAAQQAQACASRGEDDEAQEWRHIAEAMKMMRGPHQS